MKNFIYGCLLLFFMITFCGCTKSSYTVEIDKRGNITTTEINAINLDEYKAKNPKIENEINKQIKTQVFKAENSEYTAEAYKDGKFVGFSKSKTYKMKDFKNSNLPYGLTSENKSPIIAKKGIFKDVYVIEWNFEPLSAQEDGVDHYYKIKTILDAKPTRQTVLDENKNDAVMRENKTTGTTAPVEEVQTTTSAKKQENPYYEIIIKTPIRAYDSNCTNEPDKNTYRWVINTLQPKEIHLTYGRVSLFKILASIVTIVLFVLCIYKFVIYRGSSTW